MPVNPRLAAEVISNGPRYLVDLGQVGDRYFLLMIGIGLDGEIVQAVNLDLKKRVGKLAYVVAGWRALKFRGTMVNITLDSGRANEHSITVRANLIIVTNSVRYATLKLAHEAQVDDGQLDMILFKDSRLSKKLAQIISVLANRREWDVKIDRYQVHSARIAANPPVAAQVDGDLMGQVGAQAVEIRCVHKAIRVIVPAKVPANLFSHGD
jgi:diacylglycerol kinase family enzyme